MEQNNQKEGDCMAERRAMTQCERILQYIDENGSITSFDAIREFGCTRLASRICDLKKMGYKFEKTIEISKNRYGDTVHYKRYSICN